MRDTTGWEALPSELCELAALVSDKGAAAQKLHSDTALTGPGQEHVVLFTCFLVGPYTCPPFITLLPVCHRNPTQSISG